MAVASQESKRRSLSRSTTNHSDAVDVNVDREAIVAALSNHAYHLPGNTSWTQDLWQYLTNNHPVWGICCHHPYHFLPAGPRIVALVGSVCFGMILTNVIYLAFVLRDADTVHVEWKTNVTRTGWNPDLDDNVSVLSVSNVNLVLWTVGAFCHGLFDTVLWSLAACSCLKQHKASSSTGHDDPEEADEDGLRRKRGLGVFVIVELVIFVTAVATLSVVLRAALETEHSSVDGPTENHVDNVNEDGMEHDIGEALLTRPPTRTNITKVQDILSLEVPDTTSDYEFLVAYLIELGLSYFLYNPVIAIVLFSGILSCGKSPVLGGRPFEMQRERESLGRAGSTSTMTTHTSGSRKTKRHNGTSSRLFDVEQGVAHQPTKTASLSTKRNGLEQPMDRRKSKKNKHVSGETGKPKSLKTDNASTLKQVKGHDDCKVNESGRDIFDHDVLRQHPSVGKRSVPTRPSTREIAKKRTLDTAEKNLAKSMNVSRKQGKRNENSNRISFSPNSGVMTENSGNVFKTNKEQKQKRMDEPTSSKFQRKIPTINAKNVAVKDSRADVDNTRTAEAIFEAVSKECHQ